MEQPVDNDSHSMHKVSHDPSEIFIILIWCFRNMSYCILINLMHPFTSKKKIVLLFLKMFINVRKYHLGITPLSNIWVLF